METFHTRLTPDECRDALLRELPAPPALRFRLDGRAMIAREPRSDGTVAVWNVPSGLSSPLRVIDVRVAPSSGGSVVALHPRVAMSRVVVSAIFGLALMVAVLAIALLLPPAQRSAGRGDPGVLLVLLALLAVVLVLTFRRYARQRKPLDEDAVAARLRELLSAV